MNGGGCAELLNRAARMAQRTEDTERAAALAAEACALADELGNERLSIESRITLAFVAHGTAHAGAAPLFATFVPRAEAFGDRGILTRLYPAAGVEALVAGRVADALGGSGSAWSSLETPATGSPAVSA